MEILIKKTDPRAKISHGTPGSYAWDVTAIAVEEPNEDHPNTTKAITGLCFEIKRNFIERFFDKILHRVWSIKAYPRSSVHKTGQILTNSVGIVDYDYRGEISAHFYNFPFPRPERYSEGERVFQIVVECGFLPPVTEVTELSSTARGINGYGSTGRR